MKYYGLLERWNDAGSKVNRREEGCGGYWHPEPGSVTKTLGIDSGLKRPGSAWQKNTHIHFTSPIIH